MLLNEIHLPNNQSKPHKEKYLYESTTLGQYIEKYKHAQLIIGFDGTESIRTDQ